MAGGHSSGYSRTNATTRSVKVTTPSGPHIVNHATRTSSVPVFAPITLERSRSAGVRMPGGASFAPRTNPHVVAALARQNRALPAPTLGQRGGSYRRMPPVR